MHTLRTYTLALSGHHECLHLSATLAHSCPTPPLRKHTPYYPLICAQWAPLAHIPLSHACTLTLRELAVFYGRIHTKPSLYTHFVLTAHYRAAGATTVHNKQPLLYT